MDRIKDITKIPITVLEVLKEYLEKEDKLFERVEHKSGFIKYQGKGINKDFYFAINKYELRNPELIIEMEQKPASSNNPEFTRKMVTVAKLNSQLSNWCILLKKYQELSQTFIDNSRFDKIVDEFYHEFNVSEDEEQEYFTVNESIKIDETIDQLNNWVDTNKDYFLPVIYEQVKKEISETQEGLAENTKGWIIRKISKIRATIMKQGPRFLKDTAVEVVKGVIIDLVNGKLIR
jgi:hypothetical protein